MSSSADARVIRGPRVWSLVTKFIRDPIPVLRRLHERYGSLVAFPNNPFHHFDPRLYLMTFAPEFNERILTDTDTFKARGLVLQGPEGSAQRVVRFGLVSMNGEQHRRHRSLMMPAFHRRAVDGYRDQLATLVAAHVNQWRAGEQRDVAQDMRSLALDASSSVLFGYSEPGRYQTRGRLIASWMSTAFSPSVWFFQCNLPVFPFHGLLRVAEQLDREVRRMIDERRRESLDGNDVLSMLIRAHDQDPTAMTEDELVGEVSILFTAAHETNTVALTWPLFLLSQHPDILADLTDELDAELRGDAPRIDQFDRLPLLTPPRGASIRGAGRISRLRPTRIFPSAADAGCVSAMRSR